MSPSSPPAKIPSLEFRGRPVHDVRLRLFHAKRQRREAVRYKVDEQQMNRIQQRKAHERGAEYAQHLAHVGGQQELDDLSDIVVYAPSLAHGHDNCGEIVVRQHHLRHVFRHVRFRDAHADANL